ncbi:MAG: tRNA uridine(34) 5-carboxymethylaminomethyl modification radical SAM/GNAT enzyme Elp3, partial [Holophagales bacterium]|nr:tRNA uridine(34) 5-carboxymethylaminomethyl modification radical SAM/GNAT enzyme Elp3 [Holophagales bacterium]
MAKQGSPRSFDLAEHAPQVVPLIEALLDQESSSDEDYQKLVRRFPRLGGGAYSKNEIIRAYRELAEERGWADEAAFVARVRMKPVRTLSGVAPVTVLTRPHPCPGKCVFCPNDVRMPKSYLSREPGAQRAAQHRFDPYGQTLGRLLTYHANGHRVDKVELIVLGGTWSFYPEPYQLWFLERCFAAMNDFEAVRGRAAAAEAGVGPLDFEHISEEVDGLALAEGAPSYNRVVAAHLGAEMGESRLEGSLLDRREQATWEELEVAHLANETAAARCVGLVLETRPDHLDLEEVERLRRLGATKVQIGIQSLDDEVLRLNRRGHDVAATRRAMARLRAAGFKLHAHYMPNLLGSDPGRDIEDFARLFADPDFRPDELKIYPCSLIETAELMTHFRAGAWRPYSGEELLHVLESCLLQVPEYCRVTRVIRDIPGDDIVDGNTVTNFREVVESRLAERGLSSRDIRAREIRHRRADPAQLRLEPIRYATSVGEEIFLQVVATRATAPGAAKGGRDEAGPGSGWILGFLRLTLPYRAVELAEIRTSAMIR